MPKKSKSSCSWMVEATSAGSAGPVVVATTYARTPKELRSPLPSEPSSQTVQFYAAISTRTSSRQGRDLHRSCMKSPADDIHLVQFPGEDHRALERVSAHSTRRFWTYLDLGELTSAPCEPWQVGCSPARNTQVAKVILKCSTRRLGSGT